MGKIVVYTTSGCRHCQAAKSLLSSKRVQFSIINIADDPESRNEMISRTGCKTVPQIFLNGNYIGGNAELQQFELEGKLDSMLQAALMAADDLDGPQAFDRHADEGSATANTHHADQALTVAESETRVRLQGLINRLRVSPGGVDIRDRRHRLTTYQQCFVGTEFVKWLTTHEGMSPEEAVKTGEAMLTRGMMFHVCFAHDFKDKQLFYRFQQDELPHYAPISDDETDTAASSDISQMPKRGLLNCGIIFRGTPRSTEGVAANVRQRILSLYDKFLAADGSGVDYGAMIVSSDFAEYIRATAELQAVDATALTPAAHKAFFVNLYNAMVVHGKAVFGDTSNMLKRMRFFDQVAYRIGPYQFSLNDIEHGVLRGNKRPPYSLQKRFSRGDPRRRLACAHVDPRVHFALVCGARSCPPIKLYSAENVDQALDDATEAFILDDANCAMDVSARRVYLSKIFDWYASDFGGSNIELLTWILCRLPITSAKHSQLADLLQLELKNDDMGAPSHAASVDAEHAENSAHTSAPRRYRPLAKPKRYSVVYFDYDWSLNSS